MSDEQDKLKLKIEQAEAAAARAQQVYDAAEPGSVRDSCLQLLLAKEASLLADKKALEQVREKELLQQRAAAGVTTAAKYLGPQSVSSGQHQFCFICTVTTLLATNLLCISTQQSGFLSMMLTYVASRCNCSKLCVAHYMSSWTHCCIFWLEGTACKCLSVLPVCIFWLSSSICKSCGGTLCWLYRRV